MSRNKFNLKDKKTKIIISSTIIVLLLLFLGVGLGLSSMNNTDSKNIASQGQDKIDKNKTDKKDEKNEVANSSSENKDDKKEVIVTPEENKENTETSTSNSSEVASSNNSGSSESSSSSSSGSGNNGGGSSSGSSNGGGTSNSPANSHSHSWNPVTDTVWHDEVGHYETVVIKDAWTEEVPIYEEREVAICNGCGADITSNIDKHMTDNILAGNMACTGWHTDWKQVQVGTDKINHPAVTEDRWVVDKAAWSETVTTGYSCSCGATK